MINLENHRIFSLKIIAIYSIDSFECLPIEQGHVMLLMHPQVSELDFGLREACSGQSAATADQSAGGRLPVGGHATVAECVGVLLSLWGTLDVADQQENMKHHANMHSPDYFGITASSPGVTNSVYYIFYEEMQQRLARVLLALPRRWVATGSRHFSSAGTGNAGMSSIYEQIKVKEAAQG